jgi:L-lactate dehydrogenase complex protein LldG
MSNFLINTFAQNAKLASAGVMILDNDAMLNDYLRTLIDSEKPNTLAVAGFEDNGFIGEIINGNNGVKVYSKPFRSKFDTVDIGITPAQFGIAETGSVVIRSDSEDVRMASMLSNTHVVVLKSTNIVATKAEMAETLRQWFKERNSYTAFITGPSRTADIERILTLGAHGPLRLQILLVN